MSDAPVAAALMGESVAVHGAEPMPLMVQAEAMEIYSEPADAAPPSSHEAPVALATTDSECGGGEAIAQVAQVSGVAPDKTDDDASSNVIMISSAAVTVAPPAAVGQPTRRCALPDTHAPCALPGTHARCALPGTIFGTFSLPP